MVNRLGDTPEFNEQPTRSDSTINTQQVFKDKQFLRRSDDLAGIGSGSTLLTPEQGSVTAPSILKADRGKPFLNERLKDIGAGTLEAGAEALNVAIGIAGLTNGGRVGELADQAYNQLSDFSEKITGTRLLNREDISNAYSNATKKQREELFKTEGFVNTLKSVPDNPLAVLSIVHSSLGPQGVAGFLARGAKKLSAKFGITAVASGAEGLTIAGSQQEQIRGVKGGPTGLADAPFILGSGIGGALLGTAGGKLANKLNVTDVDQIFAGKVAKAVGSKSLNALKSGSIESLEELGQSGIETVLLNAALDQPLTQNLGNSLALGATAGGVMGGATSLLFHGGVVKNGKDFINPDTEAPFENKKVKDTLQKYDNLSKMKQRDEKAGRDTTDVDTRIDNVKNSLDSLKKEDDELVNDEVESAKKAIVKHESNKQAEKQFLDAVNKEGKLAARIKLENGKEFTDQQNSKLASNILERFEGIKDTDLPQTSDLLEQMIREETEVARSNPDQYFAPVIPAADPELTPDVLKSLQPVNEKIVQPEVDRTLPDIKEVPGDRGLLATQLAKDADVRQGIEPSKSLGDQGVVEPEKVVKTKQEVVDPNVKLEERTIERILESIARPKVKVKEPPSPSEVVVKRDIDSLSLSEVSKEYGKSNSIYSRAELESARVKFANEIATGRTPTPTTDTTDTTIVQPAAPTAQEQVVTRETKVLTDIDKKKKKLIEKAVIQADKEGNTELADALMVELRKIKPVIEQVVVPNIPIQSKNVDELGRDIEEKSSVLDRPIKDIEAENKADHDALVSSRRKVNDVDTVKPKDGADQYEYAVNTANTDKGLNNRLRAAYHAFNPNGIVSDHLLVENEIGKLVDEGKLKSGHLTTMDNFYHDDLIALTEKKRVGTDELTTVIQRYKGRTASIITNKELSMNESTDMDDNSITDMAGDIKSTANQEAEMIVEEKLVVAKVKPKTAIDSETLVLEIAELEERALNEGLKDDPNFTVIEAIEKTISKKQKELKPNIKKNNDTLIAEMEEIYNGESVDVAGIDFSFISVDASVRIGESLSFLDAVSMANKNNASPRDIFYLTGWKYSKEEKQWIFEIDDAAMSPILSRGENDIGFNEMEQGFGLSLDQVIDHPTLFKAYPGLKDITVVKDNSLGGNGSFSFGSMVLRLNYDSLTEPALTTLIHEVQHYIQSAEDWNRGGNPNAFSDNDAKTYVESTIFKMTDRLNNLSRGVTGGSEQFLKTLTRLEGYQTLLETGTSFGTKDTLKRVKEEMYFNLIGEVQARETASRRTLKGKRRKIPGFELKRLEDRLVTKDSEGEVSFSKEDIVDRDTEDHNSGIKAGVDHIKTRVDYDNLKIVNDDGKELPFSITTVKTRSRLPKALLARIGDDNNPRGLYDRKTNSIYIISDEHNNVDEAVGTLAHELIGHVGLRKTFGNSYDKILDQLLNSNKSLLKDVLNKVNTWPTYLEQWVIENGVDAIAALPLNKKSFTTDVNGDKVVIPHEVALRLADEYMADLAKDRVFTGKFIRDHVGISKADRKVMKKSRDKMLDKFIAKIKHMIRGVFGKFSDTITVEKLDAMLAASTDMIFKNTKFDYSRITTKPTEDQLDNLDISIRASYFAQQQAIEMGGKEADVSRMIAVSLKDDFSKLNTSSHIKFVDQIGFKIKSHPILNKFFAMGSTPYAKQFSAIEAQHSGLVRETDIQAGRFYDLTRKLRDKKTHNAEIFLYFTAKDAVVPDTVYLSNPKEDAELKELMVSTKQSISDMGKSLVGLGLLDAETFLENDGSYLQRQYIQYLGSTSLGGKSTPSLMNFLKQRDENLTELDKDMLGQIKDPGYLVASSLSLLHRDIALRRMYDSLATASRDNSLKWVLGEADVINQDGKNYTRTDIEKNIENLDLLVKGHNNAFTHNATNFSNENFLKIQKRLAFFQELKDQSDKLIDTQINASLNKQLGRDATIEEKNRFKQLKYKRMPTTKRYGKMAGQLVLKEIHDSFFAIDAVHAEMDSLSSGKLGTLSKYTSIWKSVKVGLNPPSVARNMMTNAMLLDMSTSTSAKKLTGWLISEMAGRYSNNDDRFRKYARIQGLETSTMSAQELISLNRNFDAEIKQEESDTAFGSLYPFMNNQLVTLMSEAGKFFGLQESIFKTVALKDFILTWESENLEPGVTIDSLPKDQKSAVMLEAAAHANRSLFDYSKVNKVVNILRRTPLGSPFLTFMYKSFPVMVENAAKHPFKMAPYIAMPTLITQMAAAMFGWDDDDLEEYKAKMPLYTRDSSGVAIFPIKDPSGNVQLLDLTYMMPHVPFFNGFLQAKNQTEWGSFNDGMKSTLKIADIASRDVFGILGGPVSQSVTALLTNESAFDNRDIVTEGAPAGQQMLEMGKYTMDMLFPSWLGTKGAVAKTIQAVTGEKSFDLETVKTTPAQAAGSFVGVNIKTSIAEKTHASNQRRLNRGIVDTRKAWKNAILAARREGKSGNDLATINKNFAAKFKQHRRKRDELLNP